MMSVVPSDEESNGTVRRGVESDNIVVQKESPIPLVVEPLPEVDFEAITTASTSKIIDIDPVQTELNPDLLTGYRLVDVEMLYDVFNSLACPVCYGVETLKLHNIDGRKKGLASLFILKCTSCSFEKQSYPSKTVENVNNKKGGNKFMEVNIQMGYGMRAIGAGHIPLKKL